jgi:hypothetical protein
MTRFIGTVENSTKAQAMQKQLACLNNAIGDLNHMLTNVTSTAEINLQVRVIMHEAFALSSMNDAINIRD